MNGELIPIQSSLNRLLGIEMQLLVGLPENFIQTVSSLWGLIGLGLFIAVVIVLKDWLYRLGKAAKRICIDEYSNRPILQFIISPIAPVHVLLKEHSSTDDESEPKIPESVTNVWDFSDGDHVLVVLPARARNVATDGGTKPIDTADSLLDTNHLEADSRYPLVVEFVNGEHTTDGSKPVWQGMFRDSSGKEYEMRVCQELFSETHIGDQTHQESRYRFDNLKYVGSQNGPTFIADEKTAVRRVEPGETEPDDMQEFPEHLRPAFKLIISLLRDHPADVHLDYCLDTKYSNHPEKERDIILVDVDGSNELIPDLDEFEFSIGRDAGHQGAVALSDGSIRTNSTSTNNGRTNIVSYGVFARTKHHLNPHNSCYVISGTHQFATIGMTRCLAPTDELEYASAEKCCDKLLSENMATQQIHGILNVNAIRGNIRQPTVEDLTVLSNSS